MQKIIIDIEIYKNYFLLSALNTSNNKIKHFEFYDGQALKIGALNDLMSTQTTISFNGINFDLPIIAAAISGWSVERLKWLCDKIIKSNLPTWKICNDLSLRVPDNWDHIDLIEIAHGQSSLKIYGGRLHAQRLQDLPIEPDALIEPEQREELRSYCVNDLNTTKLLHDTLSKQIDLRVSMSAQYGIDLRSKSDAQIAETVIKSELQKETGKRYVKPELPDGITFKYQNPKIVSFQSEQLKAVFKSILDIDFELGLNGAVKMPKELSSAKINIGQAEYKLGIGGLHSCEKSQLVRANDDEHLIDVDVASYYPNIILQQSLAPKSMGLPFLRVYQSIVDRRIKAKRAGDKVTADTLKICVNGSFGKLGSKWSALYAPDLLLQTTITGQLCLLMLIERFELAGLRVYSANTDGVVVKCKKSEIDTLRNICFDWMLDTSYELEETHYSLLASRDVNNYVAVTTDGELKRKGVFANGGLAKNPDCNICFTAVGEFLANGTPIEQTITNCKDITQFVTIRKVTGGAVWCGDLLGKAVRFYYSNGVDRTVNIEYIKNGNKVPKSDGAMPLMNLTNYMPFDVDYQRYIDMSKELLQGVGFNA